MTEPSEKRLKHYGTAGIARLAQQVIGVRRERGGIPASVDVKHERLVRDRQRMEEGLADPLRGRRMLVIGPGQLLREARYFAVDNHVTCMDLDVIPRGVDPVAYVRMLQNNGAGRVLKTLGRKLIGNDRIEAREWKRALGLSYLPSPECVVGDICDGAPDAGTWDAVTSWAVFQHIPDVKLALQKCVEALRPGGVLYHGIQLWTCNTGHHDIRAYIGLEHALPLWAHLRPGKEELVESSAWLNRLRLRDWRAAFEEVCPGYVEFQDRWGEEDYRKKMTPELRKTLADYDDEELYTVDVFYRWTKPL
ncbi:MAG: class I SAM-dependent methyltransferase [Nannocystaceae bacterium]|nr:class I SAM-dependent methyltransferase [Nannocystaceae bacterium]